MDEHQYTLPAVRRNTRFRFRTPAPPTALTTVTVEAARVQARMRRNLSAPAPWHRLSPMLRSPFNPTS